MANNALECRLESRAEVLDEDARLVTAAREDHAFSFVRHRYVLSDGTEIIWSIGVPTQD